MQTCTHIRHFLNANIQWALEFGVGVFHEFLINYVGDKLVNEGTNFDLSTGRLAVREIQKNFDLPTNQSIQWIWARIGFGKYRIGRMRCVLWPRIWLEHFFNGKAVFFFFFENQTRLVLLYITWGVLTAPVSKTVFLSSGLLTSYFSRFALPHQLLSSAIYWPLGILPLWRESGLELHHFSEICVSPWLVPQDLLEYLE